MELTLSTFDYSHPLPPLAHQSNPRGAPMRQNERGHVIGHVKDVGVDPDCLNPNTRIYMTRAAQPWHVDSADAVALLCLSEAKVRPRVGS